MHKYTNATRQLSETEEKNIKGFGTLQYNALDPVFLCIAQTIDLRTLQFRSVYMDVEVLIH